MTQEQVVGCRGGKGIEEESGGLGGGGGGGIGGVIAGPVVDGGRKLAGSPLAYQLARQARSGDEDMDFFWAH